MQTQSMGDRIRAVRQGRSLSQAQVAHEIGVDSSTVYRWEANRSKPRRADLKRLAALLGAGVEWLSTGEGTGPDHAAA